MTQKHAKLKSKNIKANNFDAGNICSVLLSCCKLRNILALGDKSGAN